MDHKKRKSESLERLSQIFKELSFDVLKANKKVIKALREEDASKPLISSLETVLDTTFDSIQKIKTRELSSIFRGDDNADPLLSEGIHIVITSQRASISHLQKRLKVGYNRASGIIESMEILGIVTSVQQNGTRSVICQISQ